MKDRVISHYRVHDVIGRGGMGVVYEAEDLRLGRRVALKFLPDELAADEKSRERLKYEARAASSLNHPNICTIYEVEEDEQHVFIAMELLRGSTLDAKIDGRPLPFERVLKLATEVSDALAVAHANGFVHRDLKPSNIFVTTDGIAKVMDFGLAKRSAGQSGPVREDLPTEIGGGLTAVGSVVGTMMYMSPEQLRGEPLDGRSDLFSMGLVLYEMATGRPAFDRTTAAVAIDNLLNRTTVPPTAVNASLPPKFDEIIAKALEKDPTLRYQAAADLATDLKRLLRDTSTPSMSAVTPSYPAQTGSVRAANGPDRRRSQILTWRTAAAALVVVLLAGGGLWWWRATSASSSPPSLAGATFAQLTDQPGAELLPTLSPDAKLMAYVAHSEDGDAIFVKRVGGEKPIPLGEGTFPAFSPSGEQIAFRSDRDGGGLFVMGSTGEAMRRRTTFGYMSAWSPDGTELVFDTEGVVDPMLRIANSRLWRVNVSAGDPVPITPEDMDAVQPSWSPHNKRIAFWTKGAGGLSTISTIAVGGGKPEPVTTTQAMNWSPVWSPDGRYLYFLSNAGGNMSLWWLPIDEASGRALGPPHVLSASPNPMAYLSISRDGRSLAYAQQLRLGSLVSIAIDPLTRRATGKPEVIARLTKGSFGLDVSRDGTTFTYASAAGQNLFVMNSDGSNLRQLTDGTLKVRLPRLSPDGRRIAFTADKTDQSGIWMIDTDGSGLHEVVTGSHGPLASAVWSPDGNRLVYSDLRSGVYIVNARGGQQTGKPLVGHQPGSVTLPWSWSPDGRMISLTTFGRDNTIRGVSTYNVASGQVRVISASAGGGYWLNDNQHTLASETWSGRLYIVDSVTGTQDTVFATALNRIDGTALSSDNRTLYLVLTALESDVWMLTMH